MSEMEKDEVLASFDQLRDEDAEFAALSARFAPLAEFLVEYEYLKGMQGITQSELAERMGTTQSAVSRFESMKHPPSYDLLNKAAKALGDGLFVSPAASACMSLPYDLRDKATAAAAKRKLSVRQYLETIVRESITRESFTVTQGTARVLKLSDWSSVGSAKVWGPATSSDAGKPSDASKADTTMIMAV